MPTRKLNGAALKALRIAHRVKQGELALRLDMNQGYLSKLEAGAKQPSQITIGKLADALGEPIDAISFVCTCAAERRTPA